VITFRALGDSPLEDPPPILLGYSQPGAGENMAKVGEKDARRIMVRNSTKAEVKRGPKAAPDCQVVEPPR
jgi:hypothetical protein